MQEPLVMSTPLKNGNAQKVNERVNGVEQRWDSNHIPALWGYTRRRIRAKPRSCFKYRVFYSCGVPGTGHRYIFPASLFVVFRYINNHTLSEYFHYFSCVLTTTNFCAHSACIYSLRYCTDITTHLCNFIEMAWTWKGGRWCAAHYVGVPSGTAVLQHKQYWHYEAQPQRDVIGRLYVARVPSVVFPYPDAHPKLSCPRSNTTDSIGKRGSLVTRQRSNTKKLVFIFLLGTHPPCKEHLAEVQRAK